MIKYLPKLCGVIQNSAVSYKTLRCHSKLCGVIQNSAVSYKTLRCHSKLCRVIQNSAVSFKIHSKKFLLMQIYLREMETIFEDNLAYE